MAQLTISNFPVGYIFPVVNSNVVPVGSLECNGALISQTTYANLFSGSQMSVGSLYGVSGGSFYLPDYRGRSPRGWSHGTGRDPDAATRYADSGGITGDNVGSMQNDIAGAIHNHQIKNYISTVATEQVYNAAGNLITLAASYQLSAVYGQVVGVTSGNGWSMAADWFTSNAGAGGSEGRSKNFYVMWCIKY